ncbi:MAG: hypothetical protein JW969_18810 [Spirochaetales bacterium]|nr:hypothetical protein [Spirochaetales bacterium]
MKKVSFIAINVIVFIFLIVSCSNVTPTPPVNPGRLDVRALSGDFASRKAVAYSGIREGGGTPSEAEILEDLTLLEQGGWTLIRLFSSGEYSASILNVIKTNTLDIKVMLGAWISGPDSASHDDNYAELDRAIALATNPDYVDIILAVSVGNETMVDWSFIGVPPADMAAYIEYVRSHITQPVTTDDNWEFYAGINESGVPYATATIANVVDFISIHTYPLADTPWGLWNWKQEGVPEASRAVAMMDASIAHAQSNYNAVKNYLDSHGYTLPVVVGETGWKSYPSGGEVFRAHPVNQKMYYDRLMAWRDSVNSGSTGPVAFFYFEAFDEPWKGGDDMWGLFDKDRLAKYVIYDLFPDNKENEVYTDADAVYYLPPVANPTITQDKYVLYSENFNPDTDAQPTTDSVTGEPLETWGPWDGNTASVNAVYTDSTAEGTYACEITPIPSPNNWGWGLALILDYLDDLSNFTSAGYLNFSIKTDYPGKLEVGFQTGTTSESTACDVYMPLSSGLYGYINDGEWHNVSIPVSVITPYAAPAYGMPASATLNMALVSSPLVIADRYGVTGNVPNAANKIYIDDVYWSK